MRLEARERDGCVVVRFEPFIRTRAAQVELSDEQRATLERARRAIAGRIESRESCITP